MPKTGTIGANERHRVWCAHRAVRRMVHWIVLGVTIQCVPGCYAPLASPGIPARSLPDTFRAPVRSFGIPLNYAALTREIPDEYLLGRDDVLEVEIHNLYPEPEGQPARGIQNPRVYTVRARVLGSGAILLPLVGSVQIGGQNLMQAHKQIVAAYAAGFLKEPRISVHLLEKSTTGVLVLGEVTRPGTYRLPKYENDIAHALATAGGLGPDAGNEIQVHRRTGVVRPAVGGAATIPPDTGKVTQLPPIEEITAMPRGRQPFLSIPLLGTGPAMLSHEEVTLDEGDVVVVPSRINEVFFVVGKLSSTNFVRFSLGRENRDLGAGFVLPRERDVDVVTAVAMAGYIDPIDSPTTVTVHRTTFDGQPMLIRVDLIAARYDRRHNILVQAGDIIYLNPDPAWWFRRTFDRVVPDLILFPYERLILRAFGQDQR